MANLSSTLKMELGDLLPHGKKEDIEQVIRVIQGEEPELPIARLARSILSSNTEVGPLLSALLRCEWLCVQYMIEHTKPEQLKAQVTLLSDCIENFNVLQAAIIDAASQDWQAAVDDERKSRVIAECRALWMESGCVHLHNYFHEIPVSAKAGFIRLEHRSLWLNITPEMAPVFSASADMNKALISNPDRTYNLQVEVVQRRGSKLMLSISSVEQALRERRGDVRVQMDDVMSLQINRRGKQLKAVIANLSSSGLGISMPAGGSIEAGEQLHCEWMIDKNLVAVDAIVRWALPERDRLLAGLQFKAGGKQRETIYKYLFVKQQHIIGRLRRLEMPVWLKAEGHRPE